MGWRDPDRDAPAAAPAGPVAPGPVAPGLERLVLVSRAAPGLDALALHGIVRRAHAGNAPSGLTGALVLLDGWFAQLLEGPGAGLDQGLARIRRDPGHGGLEIRRRERAHARLFAGQPLALRTRACLGEGLLEAFGYRPGFPVEAFPADVLVEFVVQACRRRRG
jgi:hypothetical protein